MSVETAPQRSTNHADGSHWSTTDPVVGRDSGSWYRQLNKAVGLRFDDAHHGLLAEEMTIYIISGGHGPFGYRVQEVLDVPSLSETRLGVAK